MKSLVKAAAIAALIAVPAVSFAQASNQPLTRAQVRAELVQYEQAGYQPSDWMHYPENIQHAQQVIAEQNSANTAYGPAAAATSQSGK